MRREVSEPLNALSVVVYYSRAYYNAVRVGAGG
jgi:hypothetical protein